jgi:intracellular multiplication protein IcmT
MLAKCVIVKEIDNIQEKLNWHWRNSMRPVRFFAFDCRAAIPFVILFVYARISTIVLAIVVLIVFRILEQRGLTFSAAIRNFRAWMVGMERPGWLGAQRKKFTDSG